jgi:WD40 repeat protein
MLLPLLLFACTPPAATQAVTDVVSLRIDPSEASLTTRAGEPATTTFTALATFDDGHEAPIDLVSWTSSSASTGTVDADGVFTSADTNGGQTTVTATHAGIAATASVTVLYAVDDVVDVDAAVPAAFAAATPTEDDTVALRYPADGTTVPRNLDGLGFVWAPPPGGDVVSRLHFRSEATDISVYTASDRWTASADLWTTIAAANRHGTVSVQVETGTWDGAALADVRQGPAIEVTVNRFDAQGSVLYWDSSLRAIMRIPFGETTPTRFWPVTDDGSCVGCHSLAGGQDRMVVTHDGVNGVFTVVDVSDVDAPTSVIGTNNSHRMTFKTLSPDGQYMMGVLQGALVLYDLGTGALISSLASDGYPVTHPDWSPDGTSIVMVRMTGGSNSDMSFSGGEIVQVPWDGTALGTPEVLVARESGYNVYYPTYSPDGRWIAYDRSTGDSYADPDAEIWLASRDGSVHVKLAAANGAADSKNSYPRWGPLPDDDVLWLAFSSDRGYPLVTATEPQIWVSAITPALAEAGEDPSSSAFWLPGQATTSNNHLPVWWDK